MLESAFWKPALNWSVRVAIMLILVGIGLALSWIGIYQGYEYLKAQSLKPLQAVRILATDAKTLKIKATVKTKYINDRMLYVFDFDGYPEPFNREANKSKTLMLDFGDDEGFVVRRIPIELKAITNVVDANSVPLGGSYQNSENMTDDEYRRIKDFSIAYTVDMSEQQTAPAPRSASPPSRELLKDPCGQGLNKSERINRLKEYGEIRETGPNTYSAGIHTVTFGYDGSLVYCF